MVCSFLLRTAPWSKLAKGPMSFGRNRCIPPVLSRPEFRFQITEVTSEDGHLLEGRDEAIPCVCVGCVLGRGCAWIPEEVRGQS